jgi:5-methylcytosine-specific restriction endonuclease McrA
MTMRPCLDCGEPADGPRCPEHTVDTKPAAAQRGYDHAWTKLSKRARRLQPFCLDCGSTEDLQCDHTPEAWARKAAGKPIRLQDVQVLCGPCNRDAGAARGPQATRGPTPTAGGCRPLLRQSLSHTPQGGI